LSDPAASLLRPTGDSGSGGRLRAQGLHALHRGSGTVTAVWQARRIRRPRGRVRQRQ